MTHIHRAICFFIFWKPAYLADFHAFLKPCTTLVFLHCMLPLVRSDIADFWRKCILEKFDFGKSIPYLFFNTGPGRVYSVIPERGSWQPPHIHHQLMASSSLDYRRLVEWGRHNELEASMAGAASCHVLGSLGVFWTVYRSSKALILPGALNFTMGILRIFRILSSEL